LEILYFDHKNYIQLKHINQFKEILNQNTEFNIDKLLLKAKNSGKFYLEKENAYLDPVDAGAAIPLQSRLHRLRQDRLSGPYPQPASVGQGLP
jgi:hypothetical protein